MSASFVSQLYENILRREPDAAGLTFWREMIEYGGISAAKMTEQFISSVEYKVHVQPIAQLYFAIFDRAPEASGLDFWVQAHRDGASLGLIATAFSLSDEFEAKYGQMDDEQFIASLYHNALRREPDEAGHAYWSAQLSGGLSRAAVLGSFSVAPEMIELRAQEVDFALLYLALTGEPPSMAMIGQSVPVRDWSTVIESIYTSPDYVGTDVPGLQRFIDPETQPEIPGELPIAILPQPDPDPVPQTNQVAADTTPPLAPSTPDLVVSSDTGDSNTDNLTNDATPTFTGTAESGSTVTLYANGQSVGSGVANEGNWSITSSALASAMYTITATATDAAGNVSGVSNGLDVEVDTVVPTAALASISLSSDTGSSSTDFVTSAAQQTISGVLTQALGTGESVQVSLDNGVTWTAATTSNTNWTLSNQTLVGSSTLIARVVDAAGNAGTAYSQSYVLDQTGPAISNLRVVSETELAFESSETGTAQLMDLFQILTPAGPTVAINSAGTSVPYTLVAPSVATAAQLMVVDTAGNATYDNDIRIWLNSDVANSIFGGMTVDYMFGFGGDDWLNGEDGDDVLLGGDGDDLLVGGAGRDTLRGGNGFDTISYADVTSAHSHGLTAIAGMYITFQYGFADYIDGGDFSLANQRDEFDSIEAVIGSGLSDTIVLGSGDMYADGGSGDDFVIGFTGDDTIDGGDGDDLLSGEGGDDIINGGAGQNTVIVGFGQDTVVHDTLGATVDVQVQGPGLVTIEAREQGLVARRTVSITQGTPQTASVDASRSIADVRIDGRTANDSLIGGSGNDTISGHAGLDTVMGGLGKDSMSGGQDADTFVFRVGDSGVTSSAADIITDFSGSEGDRIGFLVVATPNIGYQEVADVSVASVESAVTRATATGFLGAGNLSHVFVAGQVDGYLVSDLDNDGVADSVVVLTAKNQLSDFEPLHVGVAAPTVGTPDLSPISDSGVLDDDNITANNMPLFTGTAQVNSTVNLYADGVLIGTATATDGQWSIVSLVALTDGSRVITATATDAGGTVSDVSSGLTIIIDTTAPDPVTSTTAFSVDSGTLGTDLVTNEPSQTITGTLSRVLAAGETVQVSVDHGTTWTTATIATGQTNWSLANQTLSGSQLLTVRVIDQAGNQTSAFGQLYVIDTQIATPSAPDLVAASDTGDANTDNVTADSSPTFEGTAEVDAMVEVFADGASIGSVVAAGGNWSITSSPLADGVYTITAQATDVAGNVSDVSSGIDVTIDTSAPAAAVNNMWLSADTGSSPSDFVTNTALQTISGRITQALGADESVQVSVDNGVTWSTATVSNTDWTVANQTLVGSNTVVARVVNATGNFSTAYSRNYVLDQTTPTISSFGVTGEETLSFVSSEDGTAGLLPVPGQDPFYFSIPPINANQPITMVLSAAVNVLAEYLEVRDVAGNYSDSSEQIFRGSSFGDSITGTGGVDFIFGFEGNDSLSGGVDNDVLQGGDGADTLIGGSGADTLTGGADNDVFFYSSIAELFSGGALVDSIVGGDGIDTIDINGLVGFTILATDSFSRANSIETITISGQDHETNMSLTLNADAFTAGVRTITFAADENSMGQNLIDASRANSSQHLVLVGSASPDIVTGGAGNDTITGGSGNDQINPGSGTNIIYSGDGRDVVTVNTLSTNTIHLLKGLDANLTTVSISAGALDRTTTISAGTATTDMRAVVTGQIGVIMTGEASGPGATVNFTGGDGADSIVGTAGADTLSGAGGDDTIAGGAGADQLVGGAGGNSLSGGTGNDSIYGGSDDDVISGGEGIDFLEGGDGNDIIAGNSGGDIYFLGAGADTIVINAVANVSSDSTPTESDEVYDFGDGADLVRVNITNLDAFDGSGGAGSWGHYVVTDPAFMSWSSLKISPTGTLNSGDSPTDIVVRVFSITTVSANDLLQTLAYDLTGTVGDNLLTGYDNSDTIAGGDGNDTLSGGAGADSLSGGEGNDHFQFIQIDHFLAGETIHGGGGVDVLQFSQAGSISFVGRDVTGIEALSVMAGELNTVTLTQGTGIAEITGFNREDSRFSLTKHLTPFNATSANSTLDVNAAGQWTTAKQGEDFVITYWDELLNQTVDLVLDGVNDIIFFDPYVISQSGDLSLYYQFYGV